MKKTLLSLFVATMTAACANNSNNSPQPPIEEEVNFLMRSLGKFGNQWIIPGGKVDSGKTLEAALKRGLLEETTLNLKDIEFKGVRELVETHHHFILLEYTAVATNTDQVILNSEATEFGWFTKNEILQLDIATPTRNLRSGRPPQFPEEAPPQNVACGFPALRSSKWKTLTT